MQAFPWWVTFPVVILAAVMVGLGAYIYRGLSMVDSTVILAGAIPAAALALRPDFVMAHALKAWLHLLGTEPAGLPVARQCLAAASALPANEREPLEAACDRHLAYYAALAGEAEPRLRGAEQRVWLEWFDREHDNLRAILRDLLDRNETDVCLKLAMALAPALMVSQT